MNLFATEGEEKAKTWTLFFDGALHDRETDIGIVLLSPEGVLIPKAYQLAFPATNNVAEYEALITGLTAAQQLDATCIKIIGDSKLVISRRPWFSMTKGTQTHALSSTS